MTNVIYQDTPYTLSIKQLAWQKRGLQQTTTGYGRKLTTEYVIHIPNARSYRVYAICFSNSASFYIIRNRKRLFLRDWELQKARDLALSASSIAS